MRYSITTCICTCFYTDQVRVQTFELNHFHLRQRFCILHSFLRDESLLQLLTNKKCNTKSKSVLSSMTAAQHSPLEQLQYQMQKLQCNMQPTALRYCGMTRQGRGMSHRCALTCADNTHTNSTVVSALSQLSQVNVRVIENFLHL